MYTCRCPENCEEKGNTLCTITIKSRGAACKYCRYQKCLKLAGLVPKWVVSQYIPKVERQKKDVIKSPSRDVNCNLANLEVITIMIGSV